MYRFKNVSHTAGNTLVTIIEPEIWITDKNGVVGKAVLFRTFNRPDSRLLALNTDEFLRMVSYAGRLETTITREESIV